MKSISLTILVGILSCVSCSKNIDFTNDLKIELEIDIITTYFKEHINEIKQQVKEGKAIYLANSFGLTHGISSAKDFKDPDDKLFTALDSAGLEIRKVSTAKLDDEWVKEGSIIFVGVFLNRKTRLIEYEVGEYEAPECIICITGNLVLVNGKWEIRNKGLWQS